MLLTSQNSTPAIELRKTAYADRYVVNVEDEASNFHGWISIPTAAQI